MLAACSKRITAFSKICKHKNLEANLIMYVLEIPFSLPARSFRTHNTGFNFKVVSLLKKVMKLIEEKLHEYYKIEYEEKINEYLKKLHASCFDLGYVSTLPKKLS
jgi:hypothetical protein